MVLFGLGKKKEEKKETPCCCSCGCSATDTEDTTACCGMEVKEGICSIKVLGSGCKSCHELFEHAQEAVKNMGISSEVEYVTDLQKVMEYGVMSMPGLVVNETVVSMGKVLKTADVEKLLCKLGL